MKEKIRQNIFYLPLSTDNQLMINNYNNRKWVHAFTSIENNLKIIENHHLRRIESNPSPTQRYMLFKRLTMQSIEQFRDICINEFDLNITEHIEEL